MKVYSLESNSLELRLSVRLKRKLVTEVMASMRTPTLISIMYILLLIQGSLQNSVYRKFGGVFRRSVNRYCTTNRDCSQNECCVIPLAEVSAGVCRKMLNEGDACGLSASTAHCPCVRGTTCAKSEVHQAQLYPRKVSNVLFVMNWLLSLSLSLSSQNAIL